MNQCPVISPVEHLWEASKRCATLAKELSRLHSEADMPLQWEIEGAIAALLAAKSRLSRAYLTLTNKQE